MGLFREIVATQTPEIKKNLQISEWLNKWIVNLLLEFEILSTPHPSSIPKTTKYH